jgi:hypothetical protein
MTVFTILPSDDCESAKGCFIDWIDEFPWTDSVCVLRSSLKALLAENPFLHEQLAFYQEREIRPRRLTKAARSRWSCRHGSLTGNLLL